jgi:hypothetical protein
MQTIDGAVVESLVAKGDLSGLPAAAKAQYYIEFCRSLGLDPKTQPFQLLKLNGREILYAGRGATDQLARNHSVTRELISGPEIIDLAGTQIIRAVCRASLPDGRADTSAGLVPALARTPEELCNAFMKAETKAKRRATLSLLGLGLMDESETDTLPDAQPMRLGDPERDPKVLQRMAEKDAHGAALSRLMNTINARINQDQLNPEQRRQVRIDLVKWACQHGGPPFEENIKGYSTDQLLMLGDIMEARIEDAVAEVEERLSSEEPTELVLQAEPAQA